jgi:hypothetical protein
VKKLRLPFKPFVLVVFFLFSSFFGQALPKTWLGGTGSGFDWTLGSNWSGGTAPVAGDDIIFDNPLFDAAINFSIMPEASVAYHSITITRGIVSLANSIPITITIGGGSGTNLYVNGGRGLSLNNNVNITLAPNSTATIDGQLTVYSTCTYNTGLTGAETTVNGVQGNLYKGIIECHGGPVICTTKENLKFNSYSTYQHNMDGGTIPIATWDVTSTCNILQANTPPDPARFAQDFGNLTWNCNPNLLSAYVSLAPYLKSVRGNLDIQRMGSSEYPESNFILLCNSSTGTLTIGGTFRVGGYVHIDGGTVNAGSTSIYRSYQYAGALLTMNGGTLNVPSLTVGPQYDFGYENAYFNPLTGITILGGTVNINGALLIHPTCAFRSTNTPAVNIKGNLTNNGNYLKDRETVTFNGGSTQYIQGSSVSTFYNLNINNSAGGVTLQQSDAHVWNTLTFTNGKITTGTQTLMLDVNATPVAEAGAGKYVYGNLGISIPANTTSKIFPIGDASNYTPLTLTFSGTATNSIGNIVATTTIGDHPNMGSNGIYGIDPARSLNRYFTLTNNGVTFGTYSAAFTFINPADLDGSTDPLIFMVQRFSPNSWYSTTIGTRTTTTVQITGATQTEFGDFQAGQMKCSTPTAFTVTGGGSACGTNTGVVVGLSGSQAGVTYQLKVNGTDTGSPVSGGGSVINFGEQPVGTYTVVASRVAGSCYSNMTGSVTVTP